MKMLSTGSRGDEVRALQIKLKRFEPQLASDGIFGRHTERAVRLAQRRLGLFPPDGIAGPHTMARLSSPSDTRPVAGPVRTSPTLSTGAAEILRRTGSALESAGTGIAGWLSDHLPKAEIPSPIRTAVAPALKRAEREPMPPGLVTPASIMRMSLRGREFIIRHEGQPGVSNRLHHPTMGSGVTIGPGYDMKDRSPEEVAGHLRLIGVDQTTAAQAARGAGLQGSAAREFVKENRPLLDLSQAKQAALLTHIIGHYERMARIAITIDLHQHEFDAMVSYAYNPGGGWRRTTGLVNARKPAEAMVELSRHVYSKRQLVHSLVVRREAESRMFLYGEYN